MFFWFFRHSRQFNWLPDDVLRFPRQVYNCLGCKECFLICSNHVAVWMVEPSTKFGVRIKAHIRRLVGKMDNKAPSRVGGTLNVFVRF